MSPASTAARQQLQATIIKSGLLKTNAGVPRPSPSLFYFPGLHSRPVHDPQDFHWAKILEDEYPTIKKEYLSLRSQQPHLPSDYTDTEHTLHKGGKWDWHSYILKGAVQPRFATLAPETTRILQEFHRQSFLMLGVPFAFSFFSTLGGKTEIEAHSGPANLRVRCHLPLVVPVKKGAGEGGGGAQGGGEYETLEEAKEALPCGIRIGDQVREWEEGTCLVFDDSYEHEVWNKTEEERVLLLVDFWHPEIEPAERVAIQEMFEYASRQGWGKGEEKQEARTTISD